MKIDEKVNGLMEALLEGYPEGDFERLHFHHVLENCEVLAQKRGLDPTVAKLIGMIHDAGRLMNGSLGKLHAIEGEAIARKWLTDAGFEQVDVVATAIKNHRRKKRIDDSYSELIKDADSLAHQREFLELPWAEQIRCEVAHAEKVSLEMLPQDLGEALRVLIDRINLQLEAKDLSVKSVHQLRVDLRMAETLVWWISKGNKDNLEPLYKQIKTAFKRYEKLRATQVYKKILLNMGQSLLAESMTGIIDAAKNGVQSTPNALIDIPELQSYKVLSGESDGLMKKYKKRINQINLKRSKSLHQFRIFNKRVMYLSKLGVIGIPSNMIESVIKLHDLLGDLNDLSGLTALLIKKDSLKSGEGKMITDALASTRQLYEVKHEELTRAFFRMRLMLRR